MSLHFSISDCIFSIVNFLILMFVLYKFAWKKVLTVMTDRQQGITNSLERAEAARKEADETHAMLQTEIDNARREARKIVEESTNAAEAVKQNIIAEAHAAAEEITARAEAEIERKQVEALAEIKNQVSDMVLLATKKLLSENISQEQQLALVDKYIAEVGGEDDK